MEELDKIQGEEVVAPETDVIPPTEETPPVTTALPPAEEEVPPEEVPPPKHSEAFRDRIKSAYPEDDFSDDETYFAKASEQLDNLEQYRNNNMEANKALMEIFNAEPAVKDLLVDMIEGASFREAIARNFSVDELTPAEGDPDREGWKRNSEARAKRLEENEDINKMKAENTDFSQASINEFAKETKLSPEDAEDFLTKVGDALDEVYAGKISKSFLQSMYRALNYDNDIKNAGETGKIAGRNENIETKKETKKTGDGMPVIAGGGTPPAEPKKKNWMDDLVESEKKKRIL